MEDSPGPHFTSHWKVIKIVASQQFQNLAPVCQIKNSCTVCILFNPSAICIPYAVPVVWIALLKVFWDIMFLSKMKGQCNRAKCNKTLWCQYLEVMRLHEGWIFDLQSFLFIFHFNDPTYFFGLKIYFTSYNSLFLHWLWLGHNSLKLNEFFMFFFQLEKDKFPGQASLLGFFFNAHGTFLLYELILKCFIFL